VLIIGWQELMLNRRNRWVISFSILFAGLTLLVAYFGMVTSGYAGFQDFTRTSASIINLAGFLLPLFALLLGVFSFLTHREYLEILVTQPVSRTRVLLGKYVGLVLTVIGASALGFGLPGVIIALNVGMDGALSYLLVVFYSGLLAIVFVGLSVLISLLEVGGPHFFGPAGATLMKLVGSTTAASLLGMTGLLIWIVLPLLGAIWVFKKQDL
jgi:Cu-processing system permease protein